MNSPLFTYSARRGENVSEEIKNISLTICLAGAAVRTSTWLVSPDVGALFHSNCEAGLAAVAGRLERSRNSVRREGPCPGSLSFPM